MFICITLFYVIIVIRLIRLEIIGNVVVYTLLCSFGIYQKSYEVKEIGSWGRKAWLSLLWIYETLDCVVNKLYSTICTTPDHLISLDLLKNVCHWQKLVFHGGKLAKKKMKRWTCALITGSLLSFKSRSVSYRHIWASTSPLVKCRGLNCRKRSVGLKTKFIFHTFLQVQVPLSFTWLAGSTFFP